MIFSKKAILLPAAFCSMILACVAQSSGGADEAMADKYLKGVWAGNTRCVMPVLDKSEAPVIDGKIDAKEWEKSTGLAGFQINNKGVIAGQRGIVRLTTDKENLYIGVRTSTPNNDPGGGLRSKVTERDGPVDSDDSVEVLINPDSDPNTTYHLIVNQAGVIFDRKCTYAPDSADVKWNFKDVKIGSNAESGDWDLELKIPFAEIGNPRQFVKMNVVRNWSQGSEGPSAIIPIERLLLDKNTMFRADWSNQAPSINMKELGSPEAGAWDVKVSVENPITNREFVVAAMLRKITGPSTQSVHTVVKVARQPVPAGGKADLALNYDAGMGVCCLSAVLFDPKGGEVLYSRLIKGKKGAAEGRHPASAIFELPDICDGQVFYYPGFDKAAVRMIFKSGMRVESVKVFVSGKDGSKTVAEAKRAMEFHRVLLPVGAEPGEYSFGLELKVKNADAKVFENICKVTKRKFEWENNSLGKDKIVIPPFTPIKAAGPSVEVLNRIHKANAAGLWDSLEIKGREQLAGPMRWECVVDGKTQTWKGGTPSVKVVDNGHGARALASTTSDGGVTLDSDLYFEYDGFYWAKMRIAGVANKRVERLTLMIPLKNEESPMFHVVADTIRSNPAGNIPAGEGVVWDGAKLKRKAIFGKDIIHPQLVPYIWVGGVERGLCWFLDSSLGYCLKIDAPAVRVVRNGNELRLEIDVINCPSKIKDGHAFEFGMQSTPVKPIEQKWRKIVYDSSGEGVTGMDTAMCVPWSILGYIYGWCKLPYNKDFGRFENTLAILRGTEQTSIYADWIGKYGAAILDIVKGVTADSGDNPENFMKVRESGQNLFEKKNPAPAIFYRYSDPRLTFTPEDEADYFRAEWWSPQPQKYFGADRIFPVPSYLDFVAYAYYQQLKHGLQGVYLDDTYLIPTDNTDTLAQIDDEGQVHARIGLLAMRELVKRIAVMQHQMNYYPRLLIVHMTNAQLVPCFSLATSQLSWEAMFGETPLQERYSLDNIRAIDTGLQVGMDPVALGGILCKTSDSKAWATEEPRLARTALAMTLVHGVKIWHRLGPLDIHWPTAKKAYATMSAFGHWKDDCVFVPYWDNDPALKASSADVIISSYRRPGACLLIVANMKKEDVKFKLNVDAQKLGLPEGFKVTDAETGEVVSLGEIGAKAYDLKIIYMGN